MSEIVIQVQNVKRSFSSAQKGEGLKGTLELLFKPKIATHEALKGVSFEIESGAFVGLIGANGAGKTTLLKILSGLIPPSSGQATVLGARPFDRSLSFRHQISLVMGQKAQLWWDLPALDAFDLLKAIYEIPEDKYRERLNTLAELLDVKRLMQTQIRRLSLGERMKMELIGALLHWPKVIFLDEPTIGLDVLAAHKLREFLRVFNQKEKATIILTSHNMDDIERLCSRVIILKTGSVLFDGDPNVLKKKGECRLRVRFLDMKTIEELASMSGVPAENIEFVAEGESGDAETDGDAAAAVPTAFFNIHRDEVTKVLQAVMSKTQVVDMGIEEPSLESVIQRIYESEPSGAQT
ncbi:MAG: ATP-binding cassette domain-containing protein [Proteobacteria bacterium]|nr:MAG: ATP-binding cassette domain-containing protein [Pseudomonadota bacterium]